MKCIRKKIDGKEYFARVSNETAEALTKNEEWKYTSKSRYKKALKDNLPKYQAGVFKSGFKFPRKINSSKLSKHTECIRNKVYRKGIYETPIPTPFILMQMTKRQKKKYYRSDAYKRHKALNNY